MALSGVHRLLWWDMLLNHSQEWFFPFCLLYLILLEIFKSLDIKSSQYVFRQGFSHAIRFSNSYSLHCLVAIVDYYFDCFIRISLLNNPPPPPLILEFFSWDSAMYSGTSAK